MLLAIDIGNTNTVFGLYNGNDLVGQWRISTDHAKMPDEYGILFMSMLAHKGFDVAAIDGICMSSVVPPLTEIVQEMLDAYVGVDTLVVGGGVKTGVDIRYESPRDVGADRVVNAAVANPARAVGRLAPEFALGAAGVAASSARVAQLLAWVDSLPAADRQAVLAFSAKWLVDLESLDTQSHFVSRHGPQVTREQLLERSLHGTLPGGGQGRPSAASRFYDWESMEAAVREGLAYHALKGDTNFTIEFETAVGEGHLRQSTALVTTRTVG